MACRASLYVQWGCISGTEHNWKLNFSMQTHLTLINTIFEYCHASVNLGYVLLLYMDDGNAYRQQLYFFSKNFSCFLLCNVVALWPLTRLQD